jgi:hypothetical protein
MINKNIKNGDYREVFTFLDEDNNSPNKPKLLKDLVNTDATILAKVIASIFLRCVKSNVQITGDPKANTETFLVLKPKCLWLKISGSAIVDENNKPRQSISMFQDYVESEKFKISFLQRPYSVSEILTAQGVDTGANNITDIWGIKYVFTYDLNEANRTRSASISAAGNTAINCVWL